ncbi:MAG: hypothetical protein A2219_02430 [Elusimicrobia bacterium RIFOXYA2_FULL_50_26]|nr:MAG: hypothetical protein A2219_02430 [Elusimicrobia bacterium RIFOXYA2_FULL_50_26]
MIKYARLIIAAAILATGLSALSAAPPRDWKRLHSKPHGFKPCRLLPKENIRALQARGALRMAGAGGVISPTTKKVLVIRVQFPGSTLIATSKAQTETFFSRLRTYYAENSYGLLTVTSTVTSTAYTLPSSISSYNTETESALQRLIADSVNLAKTGNDFSLYDHVMIYHAGRGEEESYNGSDLWSLFYGYIFTVNSKLFEGFTIVPELAAFGSPLSVMCHEYGHQLGLPDLYNTTGLGSSTCGAWSLMDYAYGADNLGSNPPHLDPWSKDFLRFIDLSSRDVSSSDTALKLGDIETCLTTGFYKISVSPGSKEYFIVELRQPDASKTTYDLSIPGSGLLIWHIDDAIALDTARLAINTVNSGTPHLGVDLVEADKTAYFPPGEAADAFAAGSTFSAPLSNTFNNVLTSITLTDIAITSGLSTFSLVKLASRSAMEVSKIVNYPNPAGAAYFHPRKTGNVLTTLVFHLSKPPETIEAAIYTLSGERVLQIGQDKLAFNYVPSGDYKWVFQFDWDGKNSAGETVATGVYIYKIKADNEVKVGKLAIVR